MIKILVVFGTRPEAIKLSPVITSLKNITSINIKVCITGQHKEMLDPILSAFSIKVDFNLNVMKEHQNLLSTTILTINSLQEIINDYNPDLVIVQGDTIATYAGSLVSFLSSIKFIHIEAGLRSGSIYSPFPEEFFRRSVSLNAFYHFAPSNQSFKNLIDEGVNPEKISIVGNTGIDTLIAMLDDNFSSELLQWASDSKLILMSTHRRENLHIPMENIFKAVSRLLDIKDDIKIIFPIHKNPIIREIADKHLIPHSRLRIVEPLEVYEFQNLLARSFLVMTDSGGIQEEVCYLGIPTLVLRDTTERPEGVILGNLKIVGTASDDIIKNAISILTDVKIYDKMSKRTDIFGDGNSSSLIVEKIFELVESNEFQLGK